MTGVTPPPDIVERLRAALAHSRALSAAMAFGVPGEALAECRAMIAADVAAVYGDVVAGARRELLAETADLGMCMTCEEHPAEPDGVCLHCVAGDLAEDVDRLTAERDAALAEVERLRAQTARQADMISELGGAALDRGDDTPVSTALLAAIVTALRDRNAPPRPPGATHADGHPTPGTPTTPDAHTAAQTRDEEQP